MPCRRFEDTPLNWTKRYQKNLQESLQENLETAFLSQKPADVVLREACDGEGAYSGNVRNGDSGGVGGWTVSAGSSGSSRKQYLQSIETDREWGPDAVPGGTGEREDASRRPVSNP